MRDSLTVLAILLIGVLTAALIGPRFVDWDSHRALIERELSEAAGVPVSVSGRIDVALLPKPILHLGGVAVGDAARGQPHLGARSLDAELSLAALLRGQVQVVDTTLVGPELRLVQAADGGFGLAPPAAADRIAVDHLGLRDGTLSLALADGRHLTLAGIDADAEAASLRGPFKATGTVRGGAVPFRLATGALDATAPASPGGARLRVKLHLDAAGGRPSLDLDGVAAARPGGLGPGFDGTAVAAGQVALDGTPAAVPWRATARVSADRDGARAADVELRAGADLRALIAAGDGTAAYAAGPAPPRAALTLHGATLDADALAVAPAGSSVAPPAGPELLRLLLRGARDGLGGLPLRLDLGAAFDTATLAGRTALGTAATVGLGPEPGAALVFRVDGPDGARLALDGRVEPGPPPPVAGPFGAAPAQPSAAFHGRAELRSSDLRRTAAWLRPAAPDLAGWIAATAPGRSLRASAAVEASADGVAARDLDLQLDGTAFRGTAAFAPAGADRARLTADLAADALDVDRLPDPSGAAAASRGLDLDLSLSARAVRLGAPAVRAAVGAAARVAVETAVGQAGAGGIAGGVAAGGLALRVTRSGDDLRLERLALDLGGARLDASGARGPAGGHGELHAAAAAAGPLAEALAGALAPLLPAPAAAALRARAADLSPLLSPLDATLTVDAAAEAGGGLVPTRLALAGTAGGTRVEAALTPDGPAPDAGAAADRPVALSLRAAAPRGGDLLRLLSAAVQGIATPGRDGDTAESATLAASGRGTLAGGFTGTVDASLGGATASFAGRAGPAGGAGHLALRAADLGPALAAAGLPAPAGTLAAEAAGDLGWDGAAARWSGLSARVGDAAASGELSLDLAARRAPGGAPLPILHGRLAVDRLPAAALFGLALGPAAQAQVPAPGAASAWPAAPFAPPPAGLPRAELALTVGDMPLRGALHARGASLTLRTAPDEVALADFSGGIADGVADGSASGTLSLRRDGPGATLSGRLAWRDIGVAGAGVAGRSSGSEDVTASGDSPAALVASLAGTGTVALSAAALARTDPAAPARVLAAATARDALAERGSAAAEPTAPDADALRRDLAAALDAGPLALDVADAPAVLAGGVLRLGPLRSGGARRAGAAQDRQDGQGGQGGGAAAPWPAEVGLALDFGALSASSRVLLAAPGDAGGGVTVTRSGPLGGDAPRAVDPAGLVAAVQAAAIARAQDRIDVLEQDIRERAAFNRQLKAIEQRRQMERDQEREQERERAEAARQAEAARAAAEAQARAAAARAAAQAAQAAADAQRAAAEAQRRADEQARAEAARQKAEKAEDARAQAQIQSQVEAAARAEALRERTEREQRDRLERDEAEKRRFFDRFDRALGAADPPPDTGVRTPSIEGARPPAGRAPGANGRDFVDPPPPPSIMRERGSGP